MAGHRSSLQQWAVFRFTSLCLVVIITRIDCVQGQYRSPSIVEHPADIQVGKDEPATLNCHATGRPEPQITWYKDGRPLQLSGVDPTGTRHMVLNSGDLFFLRVMQDSEHDDTGTYWCVASNKVDSVRSHNATLEIAVLKEQFERVPHNSRVAEGEAAMLECRPPQGSPPPVVTWTKDDRQLDPAVNHRYRVSPTGDLVITSARVGDSGNYACTARNAYATRVAPSATLTVLVKPHLVSSSGEVTAASGATVELVCRVGGDPPPEVFWGRVSPHGVQLQLPLDRLKQEERGQVLRLRHVAAEDHGVYTCTAENPVGYVAANTTLTVHSRPVFTTKPKDARVGVDGTARFECGVSGSPVPTTYWTHEGSALIVSSGHSWSNGRISVGANNTLNIVGVKEEDTGYYACVAVGEAGAAIARAFLEVQGVSDMPPPIIAIGSTNQTLPLMTEAELPCEAKGTPEPTVSWSFEGQPLNVLHSRRHNISPMGTLRITGLRTSDSGEYTCTASSIAGSSQWRANLAVHKATNPNIRFNKMFWDTVLPEPPQNLMILSVNSTQVTLGWSRGRSGSSSIRGHTVQYWSPDLRGQWREGTTITPTQHIPTPLGTTVTNLSRNTRYVFTVRSRNKDWLSRPAAFTHVIRTQDQSGPDQAGDDRETGLSLRDVRTKLTSATVRLVSVEAMSSTALKVGWRVLIDFDSLEGVYVRYRPLDSSRTQTVGALSVETVHFPLRGERSTLLGNERHSSSETIYSSTDIRSSHGNVPTNHVISSLRPGTSYEVFVVPFYRNIEGQPTSAMRRQTLPAPVVTKPTGVHYRFVNASTIRVVWDPLPATMDMGGRLKGYNVQVLNMANDHPLIHNSSTNSTSLFVNKLKIGATYELSVRGITSIGLSPPSEILQFSPTQENAVQNIPNNSVPSPTVDNNTYMIIAIVCAAILVASFLLVALIWIYKKRNISKCPHYFSKGDGSSGPWSAYSGCWEDGSNTGGISTTRYTDGTVSAMNNTRYTEGTLTGLGNIRYTDAAGNVTALNPSLYADATGQFYDSKSGYELRPAEDMMYEDPEGLRLVSFKTRHNQRCASPEPYATTPLITANGEALYPRSHLPGNRLPPNIPNIVPMDAAINFNTHSDKGSLSSGPVIQFPPPPPPPLSGGEGGSSTTASTNSRGGNNNTGSKGAPSRGNSSQHLFMQHLPYHSTGGSNSGASHHTSPLLHPRQVRSQVSPNQSNVNQINTSISPHHNIHQKQQHYNKSPSVSPGYSQCQEAVDPFEQAQNILQSGNPIPNNRIIMDNWLSNGVLLNSGVENGYGAGSYTSRRCPSPQSSALGDAEESDDKECEDDSCWSEGGTNDASSGGSVSSLNPDLNWTEAVRLMSENKWPNDQVNRKDSVPRSFQRFMNGNENNTDKNPDSFNYIKNKDSEVNERLLEQPAENNENGIDRIGNNYYCKIPPEPKQALGRNSKRSMDRPPPAASNSSIQTNSKTASNDGSSGRSKHNSHSRNTSLTSPLV